MRRTCLAALLLLAGPAAAGTLFEDDFSAESPGFNAELQNWIIERGTVDVVEGCGGNCIDLDGSRPGPPPTLMTSRQRFTLRPGAVYELEIDIPKGTAADPFFAGLGEMGREYADYSFPLRDTIRIDAGKASGEVAIVFALRTGANDNFGPYLSRVVLREIGPAPLIDGR